ncbi:MAG: hypothetical protein K6E50_02875 [Lachnospiraceae bacterium]|nr:hypothetical protein [Lachnospiraceae bacterium]
MRKKFFATGVLVLSAALALNGCSDADSGKTKERDTLKEAEEEEEEEEEEPEKEEVTPTEEPTPEDEDDIITIGENDNEYINHDLDFLYEQYYDIINGLDPKWDKFQFINLDDDDFPEIFITTDELTANGLHQYMLITHSNAGAELIEDLEDGVAGAGGYRGMLFYVPSFSVVYENYSSAPYNNPGDNVFLLDNGHLSLYASGYTEVLDGYEGPGDNEHLSWFWNDEEVTAEEYENKLNEETLYLTGFAFESVDCMSKDTMIERLEEQMHYLP